jgi:hypothetical protein
MTSSLTSLDFRRVGELAEQGYSHRWIARRFGINRAAIPVILRQLQREEDPVVTKDDDPPGFDLANLRRCSGCGALVYLWPCLACCPPTESANHSTSA